MRLVAALAGALLLAAGPARAQDEENSVGALDLRPGETLLQVSAFGTSEVRPTIMTMEAGVVSVGSTALEALEANSPKMTAVIDAIQSMGVSAADIQTSELRVSPRFAGRSDDDLLGDSSPPPRILGYIARNTIELRLREFDRAPQVLGAMFAAGANSVEGPSFELDDEASEAASETARVEATADAERLAESYAGAFGMRIARVLRINAQSPGAYGAPELADLSAEDAYAPVEPGQLQITASILVDYALVPQ